MNRLALSIVLNSVEQDHRVLKTAESLKNLGYKSVVFGFTKNIKSKELIQQSNINGVEINLVNLLSLTNWEWNQKLVKNVFLGSELQNFISALPKKEKGGKGLIELNGLIKLFSIIKGMCAALELQKYKTVDLIYGHDAISLPVAHIMKCRYPGVKWIHDFHEYSPGNTTNGPSVTEFVCLLEKQYIFEPDALVTVSPFIAEHLVQTYKIKKDPLVFWNAPKMEQSLRESGIKESLSLSKDQKLLVYTGGALPIRGLETVIRALQYNGTFHFAALTNTDSKHAKKLLDLASSLDISDRVHFLPYVPPDEISSFIADADYGINPILKYGNSEVAMPNKLFDFIHAKLPIISSDTKAMGNFVKEKGLGWVFEADNPDDLLRCLIDSQNDYQRVKDRLLEDKDLIQEFSWNANEGKLSRVLSELT